MVIFKQRLWLIWCIFPKLSRPHKYAKKKRLIPIHSFKKYNIACLQDVHTDRSMHSYVKVEWSYNLVLSAKGQTTIKVSNKNTRFCKCNTYRNQYTLFSGTVFCFVSSRIRSDCEVYSQYVKVNDLKPWLWSLWTKIGKSGHKHIKVLYRFCFSFKLYYLTKVWWSPIVFQIFT